MYAVILSHISFEISYMPFTFYLALTSTNIRNQVARPTSRASRASQPAGRPAKSLAKHQKHLGGTASQPASQLSSRPAGRPAKNEANAEASREPAGRAAKTQTESGLPAGRGYYIRLQPAGRPNSTQTGRPAGQEIARWVPRAVCPWTTQLASGQKRNNQRSRSRRRGGRSVLKDLGRSPAKTGHQRHNRDAVVVGGVSNNDGVPVFCF